MHIFVCLKQVPDTASQIKLIDSQGIDESNIEWIINPYDEFALEAALQIKEAHNAEVSVISIGPIRVETALRRALAMGADHAHLIEHNKPIDPFFIATQLSQTIKFIRSPNLILMGKVGVDENHSATGPMLAECLNMNHIGSVNQAIQLKQENNMHSILVKRVINGILEEIHTSLPLLLTVDKGIAEPRYPSLPGIIQAKKKPLQKHSVSTTETAPLIKFHSYRLPNKNKTTKMLTGTPEEQAKQLIDALKTKEKVL